MKAFFFASILFLVASSFVHAQTGRVGVGTTTPQAQLHTTASVRHDTLAGSGARPVYADAAGNLFAKPATTFANNTTISIPDNGCVTTNAAVSPVVVTGLPNAIPSSAIRVRVNVTHPNLNQVALVLQSPAGQTLRLLLSANGANLVNTVFSDVAPAYIHTGTAPYTGHFRPTTSTYSYCGIAASGNSFGGFGGGHVVPNGTWTLRAFDNGAGTIGTLDNWSISFDAADTTFAQTMVVNTIPRAAPTGGFIGGTMYDVGGSVGIGTQWPRAPLHFGSVGDQRDVVFHEAAFNSHEYAGLGASDASLRYQVADTNAAHQFFSGVNSGASRELMRITGRGRVGIGMTSPNAPLQFANVLANRKLVLWETYNNDHNFYGFGVSDGILRYHVGEWNNAHVFYAGLNNASKELMRITGDGYVGIGVSAPHAPLQLSNYGSSKKLVLHENADNFHQFAGFGSAGGGINYQVAHTWYDHVFSAGVNATSSQEIMRIRGDGNIRVGTGPTGQRARVDIYGYVSSGMLNYRFMNANGEGNIWNNTDYNTYSLYTSDRIWCNAEINVTSDARTKTRVSSSLPAADLALVNRLRVVDYNYVDRVARGDVRVKGFIAQEVEAVMPDAVMKNSGVIPNIYRKAEAVQHDTSAATLAVTMKDAHGLQVGDTLKIVCDAGDKIVPVIEVKDSLRFTVGEWTDATDWAFVYGKQVHDLRNLDYNKIFSAGISAIQELSREVTNLEKRLAAAENSATDAKRDVASLRAAVEKLMDAQPTAQR